MINNYKMEFKNFSFLFLLLILFILIKNSQSYEKESEYDKIKNTIKSMFLLDSNEFNSSFSLKFKKIIMNFRNLTCFNFPSNFSLIEDKKNLSKYIINNITITFKSQLIINQFKSSQIEFLMEVSFEQISFFEKNYFLKIIDVIPKSNSLYISPNIQISHLSYFDEFNKMDKATIIDQFGKKFENADINSTLINISKNIILDKISKIQEHFNLLTYDLDKILNNIIGKNIECSKSIKSLYEIISFEIENIEMPLTDMNFENDELQINRMKVTGTIYCYLSYDLELQIFKFGFYNNEQNYAFFKRNYFELNLQKDKIDYSDKISQEGVFKALQLDLNNFIKNEIYNYYY